MPRLGDGGDELLVIPLGSSREVSGWWNGWIGRDPEEDEEWRWGGIDGTAILKIRVRLIFIVGYRYEGVLGSSDQERAVENKRLREIK